MRLILTIILTVFISGCYQEDSSGVSHGGTVNLSKQCLEGVVYWKWAASMAPKFNTDGTLELCIKGDQ